MSLPLQRKVGVLGVHPSSGRLYKAPKLRWLAPVWNVWHTHASHPLLFRHSASWTQERTTSPRYAYSYGGRRAPATYGSEDGNTHAPMHCQAGQPTTHAQCSQALMQLLGGAQGFKGSAVQLSCTIYTLPSSLSPEQSPYSLSQSLDLFCSLPHRYPSIP